MRAERSLLAAVRHFHAARTPQQRRAVNPAFGARRSAPARRRTLPALAAVGGNSFVQGIHPDWTKRARTIADKGRRKEGSPVAPLLAATGFSPPCLPTSRERRLFFFSCQPNAHVRAGQEDHFISRCWVRAGSCKAVLRVLMLWCFVLNPHRRSPYPNFEIPNLDNF